MDYGYRGQNKRDNKTSVCLTEQYYKHKLVMLISFKEYNFYIACNMSAEENEIGGFVAKLLELYDP